MPGNEQFREETDEEFLARLAARRAKRKAAKLAAEEAAKPRLQIPVSPKLAEAVKARPASVQVRVSAEAADGTTVIERARRTEMIEVLEVRDAKPSLVRRLDLETNEWSTIEMVAGYRPAPGAQHEYNPTDGLRRPEDE
jgi:hypothetical protein